MPSVFDLLRTRYGAEIYSLPPEIRVVGTSAVKVLDNDPQRVAYQIINISDYTMYFSYSPDVKGAENGIPISPKGGSIMSRIDDDFALVTREAYMISPSGSGKIYIVINRVR